MESGGPESPCLPSYSDDDGDGGSSGVVQPPPNTVEEAQHEPDQQHQQHHQQHQHQQNCQEAAGTAGTPAQTTPAQTDAAPGGRPAPPQPPQFPPAKLDDIMVQVEAIKLVMKTRKGITTYKTTWTAYGGWHAHRYGCPAPCCRYSGLMWLNRELATMYTTHMARTGKTSAQVQCYLC